MPELSLTTSGGSGSAIPQQQNRLLFNHPNSERNYQVKDNRIMAQDHMPPRMQPKPQPKPTAPKPPSGKK
ncbi:hypothetical protein [Yersinia enterocolitica]|nr:hypothetical protein [Yersinia enterocolitica]EKN6173804.1 hypothetical protein [Yersinia enterocolitica]HDL6742421.1 hypothetical protein [Yersinia enterocolitica]HEN3309626.1 hypothetical protein [Yersinia enterocolitica]